MITEKKLQARALSFKGDALDDRITQYKLARRHCFEEFNQPVVALAAAGAGATVGTAGAVNVLMTPENVFEYVIKGSTGTIKAPVVTGTGLDIGMDQTDNDGVELTPGITASERMRGCFKVGTDPSFFCRAKIKVEDISGTDDLCVGFRKAEAYQANVDDYDEAAYLQVGGGAIGRINSETILNNAATVTTNLGLTAWADGGTHSLEVRVSDRRAVTFWVNGKRCETAPAFSFDAGEQVIPFLFFLHSSDLAGLVEVCEWEWGFVSIKE
jgi:hypothetical protein